MTGLAGLAGGPLVWGAVLFGSCAMQCRSQNKNAATTEEAFRALARQLTKIQAAVDEDRDYASLLNDLLEQNHSLLDRLAAAERNPDGSPNLDAMKTVAVTALKEAGLDAKTTEIFQRDCGIYFQSFDAALKRIEAQSQRIETTVGDVKADVGEMKELLADFLESQKRPGVDPTTMPVPPDVLAAAHELVKSKDARERASAAIVLKLWDDARREIDALNASRATDEVFQNKALEGDFYYAQGRFDDAIAPYEVAFNLRQSDLMARNGLAIALQQARLGDLSAKKKRAIEIHEGTLRLPGLSRADWAGTQNNLGNAWQSMPTGDLAQNLTRAIECYTEAIKEYTRDAAPMQWAGAQNNLGNAWLNMPTGDRAQNLTRAIACYTEALKEHTRAAAPMDWAMTQNNLGLAWRNMPTGDRAANLRTAIACYTEALKEYTRAVAPMQWAGAQNNLGNAWQSMPTGDLAQNLTRAIECYTEALKEWTRSDAPMEWAMTQNNLALALAELAEQPGQDQCRLLRQAIASGKAALLVRTPEAFPRGHEVTAKNLAIDRRRYEALGCGDGAGGAAFDAIEPAP